MSKVPPASGKFNWLDWWRLGTNPIYTKPTTPKGSKGRKHDTKRPAKTKGGKFK